MLLQSHYNPVVFNVYKSLNSTSYDFEIDIFNELKQYLENDFDSEDIIDIYLNIKVNEFKNVIDVKLGNPRIMSEKDLLKVKYQLIFGQTVKTAIPYFTIKGRNIYNLELMNMQKKIMKHTKN
ncbi:hypothetical protein [Mammaliicoccus sciuri]|uniref:hypothetical protein n=1 Tax=Mammaliicoccus sciuri TaxID=1296 RepID=UPI0034DDAD2F